MKIVCDTNIWRNFTENELGSNELLMIDAPLTATFLNIDEILKSELILDDFNKAKNVIRRLMKMPGLTIFEPPLVYLKQLDNEKFYYNVKYEQKFILELSREIANGQMINKEEFKKYINERNFKLLEFTDFINVETRKIRTKIKNNRTHRIVNEKASYRNFISFLVADATGEPLSLEFDWTKIELFETVLTNFFIDLELGALKLKRNDVYDLFQLVYVQPGDKIWTKDKRGPLKYIMENYKFKDSI